MTSYLQYPFHVPVTGLSAITLVVLVRQSTNQLTSLTTALCSRNFLVSETFRDGRCISSEAFIRSHPFTINFLSPHHVVNSSTIEIVVGREIILLVSFIFISRVVHHACFQGRNPFSRSSVAEFYNAND